MDRLSTQSGSMSESASDAELDHERRRTHDIHMACSFVIMGLVPVSVLQMLLFSAPRWIPVGLALVGVAAYLWKRRVQRGINVELAMHVTLLLTFIGIMMPRIGLGGLAA